MSKGKFAIGAIIGAVAGIVAGVLTAPKPGRQTRADLKQKANELKDAAAGRADEAIDAVREKVDDGVSRAHEVIDRSNDNNGKK